MTFYVFVYGATATGTGKTSFASSLAYLFSTYGLSTSVIKFDGILNISMENMFASKKSGEIIWAGEEVFITRDGKKVDSDVGVYERFLNRDFSGENNILNGACYFDLLQKQVNQEFLKGEPLSSNKYLIPLYLEKIESVFKNEEVGIIEIGGTLGDDDSSMFLRALRALKQKNPKNCITICYTYLPLKSKADIISNDEPFLLKIVKNNYETAFKSDLPPDILAVRPDISLSVDHLGPLARDTFLDKNNIVFVPTVKELYDLPIQLIKKGHILKKIDSLFPGKIRKPGHLEEYNKIAFSGRSSVLVIGETESSGTYISLNEAIKHALRHLGKEADITWLKLNEIKNKPQHFDYIIVTEGETAIEEKCSLIKNLRAPLLCIGKVNEAFKGLPHSYIIEDHLEYLSRPMRPKLIKFFSSQ